MPERVDRNSAYLNGKSTTGTQTRVRDESPTSGMCASCIRDCPFLCEINLSAFRGREALYPEPLHYGFSKAACTPLSFKGIKKVSRDSITRSHENLIFAIWRVNN